MEVVEVVEVVEVAEVLEVVEVVEVVAVMGVVGIVRMVVEATTTDAAAEIERKLFFSTKIHRIHFAVLMNSYFADLLTFLKTKKDVISLLTLFCITF